LNTTPSRASTTHGSDILTTEVSAIETVLDLIILCEVVTVLDLVFEVDAALAFSARGLSVTWKISSRSTTPGPLFRVKDMIVIGLMNCPGTGGRGSGEVAKRWI